jgi:hypothetical protein
MDLETLRNHYEQAEAEVVRLNNEYDEGRRLYRERYQNQIAQASSDLAHAQKAYADAQVVQASLARDDLRQSDIDRMAPGLAPEAAELLQQGFDARQES